MNLMIRERITLGIFVAVIGIGAVAYAWLSANTQSERNIFTASFLIFGISFALIVIGDWKHALARSGYYGYKQERPLAAPRNSKIVARVSSAGAAFGTLLVGGLSAYFKVSQHAVVSALSGFIAGVALPIGLGAVAAGVATHFRWRQK